MTAHSVCVTNASTARQTAPGKRKLLWSSAAAVIAAAALPQEAKAAVPTGGFQGYIMNEPAGISRGNFTATSETVTVSTPKARIDWAAWQSDFLPTGNSATFLGSGVTDFTVLNVIHNDGQQVQLNGTVLGRLQDMGNTPAGKIWFYSPGGILVGGTAVFDVGSLVLTANDPVDFDGSTTGWGAFNAGVESNASVIISQGASIAANANNSYVALIAPRVEQRGTVSVNGAAAYVAAQEVTMTVNQGLFDIAVDVGTDDPNGVVHTGGTGGPASPAPTDSHKIYMVAVPKNEALTMLLGGSVGFATAVNAEVENGDIVLTSGGNIAIGSGTYSSNLLATASGDISVTNEMFASDLELRAEGSITTGDIEAGGTFTALANGNMSFGDVVADEVYLADYVPTAPGTGGLVGTCVGSCGILGPDGVVTAPPGGTTYTYVTTEGGVGGAGQLPGVDGTNGSTYTTTPFSADAGDDLNFAFNYVTSDGSGFADYAWAALYTTTLDPVAILYTARTQPSGTIVPGQGLPGVEATLNPSSVPIIPGGPEWTPLGSSSGGCYADGCGYTGWVSSTFEIAASGNYVLRFGVSNWSDNSMQSGMAFSGITVGGVPVEGAALRTGGSISIGNVNTGSFTAAAGTTLTTGVIDTSGGITMDAGGAIVTNNLFAGALNISDAGAGITVQSASSGPSIEINSDASVTTGNIHSAQDVDIRSDGWIDTGNVAAAGGIDFEAAGSIDAGTLAGATVHVDGGGYVDLGNVNAGSTAALSAGGNLSVQDVTASQTINLTSGSAALIYGDVVAPQITVTSRDIYVSEAGSLGLDGVTELLTLNAVSDNPVIIGETGQIVSSFNEGIQYHLDEDGDIEAAKIVINAVGVGDGPDPDIHVYNVDVEGSAFDGGGTEHVQLNTDGSVLVRGLVLYAGAADTDLLEINAGQSIQVNTSSGGRIAMVDGSEEAPSGILELSAADIWVGDEQLLAKLAENQKFSGRAAALATNNGSNTPEGNVIADGMVLRASDSLLVQNSGTSAAPAGLTVGSGDLTIISSGQGPVTVIANGQRYNSNGSFTGGSVFAAQVDYANEGAGFTNDSTFNGCALTGCAVTPNPSQGPIAGPESVLGPVGLMDSPLAGGLGNAGQPDEPGEEGEEQSAESIAAMLGLISTGGLSTQQLIDEGVTSGSDSGQWDGNLELNPGE